jgi:hypothetical protein
MKQILYILFFVSLISSCEKEVEINLDEKNPQLPVFSGWISTAFSNQAIKIQRTKNFSSPSNPTYISNATIQIINNTDTIQYVYNLSSQQYEPTSSFVLQEGECKVEMNVENVTYKHAAPILKPIILNDIFIAAGTDSIGTKTGLLVDFQLPLENNYALLFELLVDSTGMGINYKSLTPTIMDMELFQNHIDEYNTFGDIIIFNNKLKIDNGNIVYKLIAHRISDAQYNYILRFQEEYDGNLYSPQPSNVPTIISNNGLGIILLSADSFIEFTF